MSVGSPTGTVRPLLAKIALVIASSAVALGIAELAVRLLGLAPDVRPIVVANDDSVYMRSDNPILGFELKPDYRNPHADLSKSFPSTNSHGQRDHERTLEKPAGVRRILLLGDSVVEGQGIREIRDTLSGQLERLYPPGTVEVLNFGVSGYCTRAEIELLEVKGLEFQPDIVVVVFVFNDFDNFNQDAFLTGARVDRPAVVDFLFLRSHLFRLLCIRLDWFRFVAQTDPLGWNDQAIGDNNVAQGFERLAQLADEHGFSPVVAIWPTFGNDGIFDRPFLPGDDTELIVERLAGMYGIPTYRVSGRLEEILGPFDGSFNPRLRYTLDGDGTHPTRECAEIAAPALRSIIADLKPWSGATAAGPREQEDLAAIEEANKIGLQRPDYSQVYVNRGADLIRQGKFDEAIEVSREAIRHDPDSFQGLNNLGSALLARGRAEEAIVHLRKAIETAPGYAIAHANLGAALTALGDREQGMKHTCRAVQLNPNLVRSLDPSTRQAVARTCPNRVRSPSR
jgi:lysophospholipase L1-like esterase